MITEHALLPVVPGRERDFEAALESALPLISCQRGFRRLSVTRGIESPSTYLLIVEWDTVADHSEGFRTSPEYAAWRALLHPFYDPFPVVEHFEPVLTA